MPGHLGLPLLLPLAKPGMGFVEQLLAGNRALALGYIFAAQLAELLAERFNPAHQLALLAQQLLIAGSPLPALLLAPAHTALQRLLLLVGIPDFIAGLCHPVHKLQKLALQALFLALAKPVGDPCQLGLFIPDFLPQRRKLAACQLQILFQRSQLPQTVLRPLSDRADGRKKLLPVVLQMSSAFSQQLPVALAFLIGFAISQ
ncbi:hypothetical protein D3C71_1225990 [compost metagenome]